MYGMGAVGPTGDAFTGELQLLKRRGCILLVVGPGAGTTRCNDLLGGDEQNRERLVVDARHGLENRPGNDSRFVRVGGEEMRSATAASSDSGGESLFETLDLDAVADELETRIDRTDLEALDPGELRVCLGDLGALGSDRSAELVAFVETVGDRIREASGMGHAHLPDTSPLRATIEPLFDVTIEVRPVPEGRQQRWLLHEADLDSGWIPVDD